MTNQVPKQNIIPIIFGAVFLSLLMTLPGAFLKPFFSKGEAREARTVQVMMETGNYILPERANGEYATKPPLSYWLIATTATVAGKMTEATTRIPSAIAAAAFAGFFLWFLVRQHGLSHSVLTLLLLFSSFEWYRAASSNRVDLLLAVMIASGLLAIFQFEKTGKRVWFLLGACFLAAAALTKGPIGVALPILIYGTYLLVIRCKFIRIFKRTILLSAVSLIPLLLWYFWAYQIGGDEFLSLVSEENLKRFVGTMTATGEDPHQHGILYLIGMFCVGTLPWGVPVFLSLIFKWSWWKTAGERFGRFSEWEKFSVIAVVITLTFFFIPSSKRGVYLLPAYPFLASLVSLYLLRVKDSVSQFSFTAIVSFFCFFVVAAAILSQFYLEEAVNLFFTKHQAPYLQFYEKFFDTLIWSGGGMYCLVISLLAFGVLFVQLWKPVEGKQPFYTAGIWCLVLLCLHSTIIPKYASSLSEQSLAGVIKLATKNREVEIENYEVQLYGAGFYLNQPVSLWDRSCLPDPRRIPRVLLTRSISVNKLRKNLPENCSLIPLFEMDVPTLKPYQFIVGFLLQSD